MASGLFLTINEAIGLLVAALVRMDEDAGDRFLRTPEVQKINDFLKGEGFSPIDNG